MGPGDSPLPGPFTQRFSFRFNQTEIQIQIQPEAVRFPLARRTEGRRILEVGGCSKWDYYQNLPFGASGHHGPNTCIEIGARANRRRAEGGLYVWGTAFTVQRALCTFRGKGHPVQRALRTFIGKGTMAPI